MKSLSHPPFFFSPLIFTCSCRHLSRILSSFVAVLFMKLKCPWKSNQLSDGIASATTKTPDRYVASFMAFLSFHASLSSSLAVSPPNLFPAIILTIMLNVMWSNRSLIATSVEPFTFFAEDTVIDEYKSFTRDSVSLSLTCFSFSSLRLDKISRTAIFLISRQ
ncbi:hypothetical protein V8G54_010413 [Vigna mungo]|uniref:Uncharacterized protein n=1 Tax=Vigna mungo TaxID=3915 RepID=A0AAQ3S6D7_VIGMU